MSRLIKKFCLYGTAQCHLCELAETLLPESVTNSLQVIEITEDDQLLLQYGLRIPVLKRLDTNAELEWPFDLIEIAQLLRN